MAFKLAINAGHGNHTGGKRCMKAIDPKETSEWYLNARIVSKILAKLKEYDGLQYVRLDDPTGEKDVPLKTRTDKANAFGADFYLAIHHNAGIKGGKGGGVVAYVWDKSKDNSPEVVWRNELYNAIIKHTGLKGNRSQPLGKADFHEVRESKMPAVLVECGFMDSTVDTPIILTDKFAEQVAAACVEVIVKKGGLKKKQTAAPAPTKPTTTTNKIYRVQVGAYSVKANAEAMQAKLKKAGFDALIVEGTK